MIYHKDWLIRQIEQMVDAVTHLLAQTATAATITQTIELDMKDEIEKALRAGEICKTEDWLYEHMDTADISWLQTALFFYSELNRYSDEDLFARNFSREEIESGLRDICSSFGYPII